MHLPDDIARRRLVLAANRGDVSALETCFACTDNIEIIDETVRAFIEYAIKKCLEVSEGELDLLVSNITRGFIAIKQAQFEYARRLISPPFNVVMECSGGGPAFDRAADALFAAMTPDVVDFNCHPHSLLLYVIRYTKLGPRVIRRLFDLGCAFTESELDDGAPLAAIIDRPDIASVALEQLSFFNRIRGKANAQVKSCETGGTALHYACMFAPDSHLFFFVKTFVDEFKVDPTILDKEKLSPRQILERRRDMTLNETSKRIINECIELLSLNFQDRMAMMNLSSSCWSDRQRSHRRM
jgi:hypothetical protein